MSTRRRLPPQIFPSGDANGYHYEFTPGAALAFEIRATPAVPGVTGDQDCSVDETLFVRCVPADGAEAGRAEAPFARHRQPRGVGLDRDVLAPDRVSADERRVRGWTG